MRSSDQRYFHVQRIKREHTDWTVEIVRALQEARIEGQLDRLRAAIHDSADEFPVVLFACGRTSNDFRRSFRRGAAGFHNVPANNLAPMADLLAERLDGYALIRLTREQHRIVKSKSEKLFARDRLISDPQGTTWLAIIEAHMAGEREEHIDLLLNLRERGRVLNEQDRAGYQIAPFPTAEELPDNLPTNEAVLPFAAAMFTTWQERKDRIRWDAWRSGITTSLRMLEAYLTNESMMVARYCRADEPTGHEHRRHFQARVDHVEEQLGGELAREAATWDGNRPEAMISRS